MIRAITCYRAKHRDKKREKTTEAFVFLSFCLCKSASITIANTKITQKKCLAFKKKGKKKVLIIFL
ncbi:MAG: hypothetical protein EAZ44_02720 [Cytophagia bacterium]|nr:MAG: hypothetical protein EAZ44_02720 [Cytophagia bacterium]